MSPFLRRPCSYARTLFTTCCHSFLVGLENAGLKELNRGFQDALRDLQESAAMPPEIALKHLYIPINNIDDGAGIAETVGLLPNLEVFHLGLGKQQITSHQCCYLFTFIQLLLLLPPSHSPYTWECKTWAIKISNCMKRLSPNHILAIFQIYGAENLM